MRGENIHTFREYAKNRILEKFGTAAIHDDYLDYILPVGLATSQPPETVVYHVFFYDRRLEYTTNMRSLYFINKEKMNEMLERMREYNEAIKELHDELFQKIIDNDYLLNKEAKFEDYLAAEEETCKLVGIPSGDFDWRVVSSYIDQHYLGYYDLRVYDNIPVEKPDSDSDEEFEEGDDGPFGGAFRSWGDYWYWREGYSLID